MNSMYIVVLGDDVYKNFDFSLTASSASVSVELIVNTTSRYLMLLVDDN